MKKILVVLTFFTFGCLIFAGKIWEDAPYTEWNEKQALKVRTDSPWASIQTFTSALDKTGSAIDSTTDATSGGGPSFGGPQRRGLGSDEGRAGDFAASRQYYVRFQSAKPVRMAIGRLSMINNNTDAETVKNFVETPLAGGDIVVMISLAPGQERTELDNATTDLLKNETYLITKQSKRRIQLKQYLTPAEAGGLDAVFIFPRQENGKDLITVAEKEVRFVTELSRETKINRKFKLKDMVFQGKLEM